MCTVVSQLHMLRIPVWLFTALLRFLIQIMCLHAYFPFIFLR